MAARKRKNRTSQTSTGRLLLVLMLALIIVAGYLAYVAWERETQRRPAQPQWADNPAELISENRILFAGIPRPSPDVADRLAFTLLKRKAYLSGYSESRKEPLWVSYRIEHNPSPFRLPRPSQFMMDPDTQSRVKDSDYTRSGYDRGHLAPNAAIAETFGRDAQLETFYMSNICPQAPLLNQNVWENLERAERNYLGRLEEVWVITGPIFADMNGSTTPRLASGVAVPSHFFKILIDEENQKGGKPRTFAVIIPQDVKGTELPQEFLTTIDAIETQTGFDFLWKLEDESENAIEAAKSRMW